MLAGVISLLTSYGNLDLIIKYQIKSLVGMSGMVYWLKINKINKMSLFIFLVSVFFFLQNYICSHLKCTSKRVITTWQEQEREHARTHTYTHAYAKSAFTCRIRPVKPVSQGSNKHPCL